ncbi:MAG: hypothetical protein GY790_10095 [Bacteroidetes bacterium]|nr:hypothetical protein [Bacteroidota bacterium]
MKSLFSIITFLLLFFFMPLFSKTDQDAGIALRLNKGDQFLYEIKIESSQTLTSFNGEAQLIKTEQRTRLQLKVEEIPKQGTYLFSCKKLFTRKYTTGGDEIRSSDSRFPEYGQDLRAVISCYLNSVEYFVLFNTKKGKISITNLDQIRTGLTEYLQSRGIEMDEPTRIELDYFPGEELIMQDLRVFNFYPGKQGVQAWVRIQAHYNKEVFNLINESDSTYTIQSKIPKFNIASGKDGVKYAGVRLPRELTVDSKSGILLSAESFQKRAPKKQMNYHYKLDLLSYSKWDKQTIICGQIQGAKSERLCLEYNSFMVGHDVDHIYVKTKADGSFSIPLEINEPYRYRLYLLESFPVGTNKHIDLYVEPGDSIHLLINMDDIGSPRFSGKGYENSDFLNRSPDMGITPFLRVYLPIYFPPVEFSESLERTRESMIETEKLLYEERSELTQGFYNYMNSELQSLARILKIFEATIKLAEKANSKEPVRNSLSEIPVPQIPYYDNLSNLEFFTDYASQYARFHFYQIFLMHKDRYGYDTRSEQMVLSRILLEGYPLYDDLVNQLEELATMPGKERLNYKGLFNEFLESSNNQEVNGYVRHLFKQIELLQPGNEMPQMDLIDLGGKEWDWDKTEGKIVVLMLFGDYNSAHYLCEDLYKEYGYNKKDVIILRISPGISFEHWKSFNTSYSTEMHQMYYPGGEDAFNERFTFSFYNRFGFLISDRNGKIFRNADLTNVKTAIKVAIAQPLLPGKPFSETTFARILFGALLGILLSFTIYRVIIHRRLKQRALINRMSELEQRAMKAQLNPHFLFNSLNSIQHLIRSNQQKEADSYLTVFASLIRKILDNSEKASVSVSEELETIKLYLELEQMRFDFQYGIQIDPEIDVYNTMIPTMMLQPVVENAISHGLASKQGERKLSIDVRIREDIIIFKVEDNGIGRAASSKLPHAHDSKGLNIIHSRIDILNRTDPNKYKLEIIDLVDQHQNGSGTLVQISVPDEK